MKKGNKNKELTTIIFFFGWLYEYSIRKKDLFVKTYENVLWSFPGCFLENLLMGTSAFVFS